MRFGLPNRPPRLTEVAVVIAAMAAVTMVFAWQRKHDGNNNAAAPVTTVTAPAVPVITQVNHMNSHSSFSQDAEGLPYRGFWMTEMFIDRITEYPVKFFRFKGHLST